MQVKPARRRALGQVELAGDRDDGYAVAGQDEAETEWAAPDPDLLRQVLAELRQLG